MIFKLAVVEQDHSFLLRANIVHMVVLSKSISGYGFPMSLLLIKPEFDIWEPGEHTGTGKSIGCWNSCSRVSRNTNLEQGSKLKSFLESFNWNSTNQWQNRNTWNWPNLGIDLALRCQFCQKITSRCFELGLIVERVGRNDTVIKIPLTIELHAAKGLFNHTKLFCCKIKLFTNYPNSNFYQEKDDDCKSITLPEDLFSEKSIGWTNYPGTTWNQSRIM